MIYRNPVHYFKRSHRKVFNRILILHNYFTFIFLQRRPNPGWRWACIVADTWQGSISHRSIDGGDRPAAAGSQNNETKSSRSRRPRETFCAPRSLLLPHARAPAPPPVTNTPFPVRRFLSSKSLVFSSSHPAPQIQIHCPPPAY